MIAKINPKQVKRKLLRLVRMEFRFAVQTELDHQGNHQNEKRS